MAKKNSKKAAIGGLTEKSFFRWLFYCWQVALQQSLRPLQIASQN